MPNATSSTKRLLITLLFFISGFSGLIYQVLWTRQFKLLLGSSIVSVSIIVATFMMGLLIGSWWIGRQLEQQKVKNELRFYGYLEIAIGVYGLALLIFLPYTKVFFSIFGEPSIAFNYLRLIANTLITFLILGLPTAAMGATLPLLINYFSKSDDTFRKTTSQFYSINALGGAIASFVAGFYLIKDLGVSGSIGVAIVLNLIIGAAAIYISSKDTKQVSSVEPILEKKDATRKDNSLTKTILATSFLTGFIAISYEVLWIRCLNYILNNSTYTFAIILFVFLVGISLGSLSMSYIQKIKNKMLTIAILQYLLAFSGVLIIFLFYYFAYTETFADWFLQNNFDTSVWNQKIGLNLTLSVLVFLFPAILMGMTFPLLSELYYEHKQVGSGLAISQVYVVNTFGSILGALVPIFILIPIFGSIKITLYLLAVVNLLIALYFTYLSAIKKRNYLLVAFSVLFGLLLLGTQCNNTLASLESIGEDSYSDEPLFYKEGVMATVKIYKKEGLFKSLSIDGVTIASEAFKGKESTIGHLPFFTNRNIKNVLAVGLASGSTVGSILKHKDVEQVDIVEIIPSIIDAVDFFKNANADVKNNPRAKIYIDDILSHLNYSDKKYDVISSDGKFGVLNKSNTTMLSKDYYEICKEHLTENGLFIQWISTEVPNRHFKAILATTQAVFPHSEMFLIRKNLYIMSSLKPIELSYDKIAENYNDISISKDLYESRIFTPNEVLSYYIGPNLNLSETNEYNTLNKPIIEYDYNIERAKDVEKARTSFYLNLLLLQKKYTENKATILSTQNTLSANKKQVSFQSNASYISSRVAYLQAVFALEDERQEEALQFFQQVINENHAENNNNIAHAAKTIGETYLQQKNYLLAIEQFNLAIQKMDGYSDAFTLRGVSYFYLGDTITCKSNMEKAISLNPNDGTASEFLKIINQHSL
jgi:spermidine synthase